VRFAGDPEEVATETVATTDKTEKPSKGGFLLSVGGDTNWNVVDLP
jgi:hypothetical protein